MPASPYRPKHLPRFAALPGCVALWYASLCDQRPGDSPTLTRLAASLCAPVPAVYRWCLALGLPLADASPRAKRRRRSHV